MGIRLRLVVLAVVVAPAWVGRGVAQSTRAADSAQALAALEFVEGAATAPAEHRTWQPRIDADSARLRRAYDWLVAADRAEEASRFAVAMRGFLPEPVARSWFARLLDMPAMQKPSQVRLAALATAAVLAFQVGDQEAATRLAQAQLAEARAANDASRNWTAQLRLSQVALRARDLSEVHRSNDAMLAFCVETKDERCATVARTLRGEAARMAKNYELAASLNEQNLEFDRVNRPGIVTAAAINLAFIDLASGRTADVDARLRPAFAQLVQQNDRQNSAVVVAMIGAYEQRGGRSANAALLFGAADAALERLGALPDPADQDQIAVSTSDAEHALGWDAFARAFGAGRALSLEEALARTSAR